MKLTCFVLVLIVFVHSISCLPTLFREEKINEEHTVVLFVFSGLRSDSLSFSKMPTLSYLQKHGVYVQRKIDAFQTESLSSFSTMLTGNYPESHGIMGNRMKNLITKENFDVTKTDLRWWSNVNPIWLTNDKNNSASALCYIPGHDVLFKLNKTVQTCANKKYTDPHKEMLMKGDTGNTMPFNERVSFVKNMLNMSTNRPTFIAVYFEEPYYSIMRYGLWSHESVLKNETKAALDKVEDVTKEMFDYLADQKLLEKVNFIVTGESGFTEQPEEYGIFLEDYLKTDSPKYTIIDDGPIMQIYPEDKTSKEKLLTQLQGKHNHMSVYDGEKLPVNFHYSNTNLTAPILIASDEKWRVYKERIKDSRKVVMGYDGKFESTHTLFLAHGPAFNHGTQQAVIGNVDVYALLCKALKIKPHLHSGNYTTIEPLLRVPKHWIERIAEKVTSSTTGLVVTVIIAIALLFIAIYMVICSIYRTVGWCVRPRKALKVKIQSLKKKHGEKKMSGEHLLSESELSDLSDSDDDLGYGRYVKK